LSGAVGYATEPKQHEPKKKSSHNGIEIYFYVADFTENTLKVLDDVVEPAHAVQQSDRVSDPFEKSNDGPVPQQMAGDAVNHKDEGDTLCAPDQPCFANDGVTDSRSDA